MHWPFRWNLASSSEGARHVQDRFRQMHNQCAGFSTQTQFTGLPSPLTARRELLDILFICSRAHMLQSAISTPDENNQLDTINWDAIGAIGDFAGSIGVFISLIYIALQMRHSAAETRDASIHSVMQLAIQFRAESYTGELAEICFKAASGATLTALESLKFEGYLSALFELNELVFVQYQKRISIRNTLMPGSGIQRCVAGDSGE